MAAEDVSQTEDAARQWLRRKWSDTGDTDAVSCPSCDAEEFEWTIEDEEVRVRCRHCGYVGSRRYEAE
ncbi:MAG: hypothetical protein ABEH90_03905 [Halolamina sp.]